MYKPKNHVLMKFLCHVHEYIDASVSCDNFSVLCVRKVLLYFHQDGFVAMQQET